MVKWITNSLVRADYSAIPEFYSFLPLVFLMESYEADDELKKVCTAMLAAMAQSMTLSEFVPFALKAIQEVILLFKVTFNGLDMVYEKLTKR